MASRPMTPEEADVIEKALAWGEGLSAAAGNGGPLLEAVQVLRESQSPLPTRGDIVAELERWHLTSNPTPSAMEKAGGYWLRWFSKFVRIAPTGMFARDGEDFILAAKVLGRVADKALKHAQEIEDR